MIRRPPRSTQSRSSAASDVYKRQVHDEGAPRLPGGLEGGDRRRHRPLEGRAQQHPCPEQGWSGGTARRAPLSSASKDRGDGRRYNRLTGRGARLVRRAVPASHTARAGGGVEVPVTSRVHAPVRPDTDAVSYTHLRAHETRHEIVCRLLLEKK